MTSNQKKFDPETPESSSVDANEPHDDVDNRDAIENMLELSSERVMGNSAEDDDHAESDDHDVDDADGKPPNSSREFIARWIIDNRLGALLQPVLDKRPYCILIEVPEPSWSEPLGNVIGKMVGRLGLLRHMSDLVITADDLPKRGNFETLREKCNRILSRGDPLVIVVPQPRTNLARSHHNCGQTRRSRACHDTRNRDDHRRYDTNCHRACRR